MMKFSIFTTLLLLSTTLIEAENNATQHVESNVTTVENNQTTLNDATQQQVEEQMRREEKYAKEQVFYQGDDYDLKSREINEKSLENLNLIEPDFDFEMDDVYRDDL